MNWSVFSLGPLQIITRIGLPGHQARSYFSAVGPLDYSLEVGSNLSRGMVPKGRFLGPLKFREYITGGCIAITQRHDASIRGRV